MKRWIFLATALMALSASAIWRACSEMIGAPEWAGPLPHHHHHHHKK